MNYKLIKDEEKFKQFIDWLPELKHGETYFLCLLARKKYAPNSEIKSEVMLKRLTSDKQYLYSKVKQLECELGSYTDNGLPIPEEALALYININPRNFVKATQNTLKVLMENLINSTAEQNPQSVVLTAIQSSASPKRYADFDFDNVSEEGFIDKLDSSKINKEALTLLKTRGGFHLLVNLELIGVKCKKTWYQYLSSLEGADAKGDNLTPIPGCTQGNFTPYIVK